MRAQAVLFDKDGTLFDFQKTWSGWAAGTIRTRAGADDQLAQDLADAMGFDLDREKFLPSSVVIAGTAMETVQSVLHFFPDMSAEELEHKFKIDQGNIIPHQVLPLPGFLQGLTSGGLKIGIATNDAEAAARMQLDTASVTEMFHFIAGYDSGYGAKPAPGMCSAFADFTGIPADQIVMVGDSTHDLVAGRAAGMQCVAVLTGVATADDLVALADIVLPDISMLPDWLKS